MLGRIGRARLRGAVKIRATIAARAAAEGLPFLAIGGNAVIAYGYPRMTRDLDLLAREDDRRARDTLSTGPATRRTRPCVSFTCPIPASSNSRRWI